MRAAEWASVAGTALLVTLMMLRHRGFSVPRLGAVVLLLGSVAVLAVGLIMDVMGALMVVDYFTWWVSYYPHLRDGVRSLCVGVPVTIVGVLATFATWRMQARLVVSHG